MVVPLAAEYPVVMGMLTRLVVRALGEFTGAWTLKRGSSRRYRPAAQLGGGDAKAASLAAEPTSASPRVAAGVSSWRGVYRDAAPRPPKATKRSWPSVGKHKYASSESPSVPAYVAIAARQMCQPYIFSVRAEGDGWLVRTLNPTGKPSRWRDEASIAADGTVLALPSASPELARWFPARILRSNS
jgi:hypothetical protein